jgi:hypothetical protein
VLGDLAKEIANSGDARGLVSPEYCVRYILYYTLIMKDMACSYRWEKNLKAN